MSPLNPLVLGAILGASLAVPPGPMNAWIAAASARSYRAGFVTGLGAASADGVLAGVVYLVYRLVALAEFLPGVYVLGAATMGWSAYRLYVRVRRPAAPPTELTGYSEALALGLSNPFQILWWLTAGVGLAYVGGDVLFVGLFGAIAVWIATFPWLVREGARRSPKVERAVTALSSAALAAFAGYFVYLAVTG